MFENQEPPAAGTRPEQSCAPTDSLGLQALVPALRHLARRVSDDERLAQIRALEEIKSAATAAQMRIAVDFDESQRTARSADELDPTDPLDSRRRRARQVGAVIGAQLARARRESPHAGAKFLRTAKALVHEMPHTFVALERGRLNEHRASIAVRETACLAAVDRTRVDAMVCADLNRIATLSNRQLEAEIKTAAYRTDPEVVTQRAAYAVNERCVSIRPAPDTMVWLSALLPVAQGVAAYAALTKHADSTRATGDERSRGQVMADVLVERLTGQTTADAVPIEVNLVMTDRTLLAGDAEPAHLLGYGTVPGEVARRMLGTDFWLRRLYTHPTTGQLVAMDSKSRFFPAGLAKLITLRDQRCRTPWCAAPIRQRDHVQRSTDGGATSLANGQGLCVGCNQLKDLPHWPTDYRLTEPPDPPGHIRPAHPPPVILEIYRSSMALVS